MRKLIGFFLLAAMLVSLAACGGAPAADSGITADHSDSEPEAVNLSMEEQKQILEANRESWAYTEPYESPWFYTFTDLDHNGRLEVIAASTQGSGIFTYANFWEVSPDGSGIENVYHKDVEIEGPDDWPEIVQDSLPCYYDAETDRYFYLCEGVTRDGYAYQYYAWYALCLKNGAADWEFLASKTVEWHEEGDGVVDEVSCRDAQGNPITEQEYETAAERRFAGMEKTELRLDWTREEISWEEDTWPEDTAAPAEADAEAYRSVLNAYQAAYSLGKNTDREYLWNNELSEAAAYSTGIGYALEDLDGDGVSELMIAGIGTDDFSDRIIYGLYTLKDGEPVNVFTSMARDRNYLRADNTILNISSGGAAFTYVTVRHLSGTVLEDDVMVFTDMKEEDTGNYKVDCYYQQGHTDTLPSEKSVLITEQEFDAYWDEMESSITVPALTPLF